MPSGRDLHLDVPLSNMTVKGFNDGMGQFIGQMVFPPVSVGKESNKYYTITKDAFLRIPDTKRSRKTGAKRIEFSVSSDNYFADEYALAAEIALQDLDNSDNQLRLRQNNVRIVQRGLLADLEVRVANAVTSISNIGSGVTLSAAGDLWSSALSDPIAQVSTGHAFIENTTGVHANTMIIDKDTLRIVRRHPMLLDMFKYTSGGELTDQQLRDVFEVERMLVGKGIKENALEGGTSSITNIWGNNVVLAYIDPNPMGLETMTLGAGIRWTPPSYPAAFTVGRQQFRGPGTKNIEVLEAGYFQDEKIIAPDLGYAILNTL